MDAATQWPQELGLVRPNMEDLTMSNSNSSNMISNTSTPRPTNIQLQANSSMERRLVRPQREQALNCPRCNSANTKFCYYNNYSLTQPRYFCKACRRYWTDGGSLRNVPVGGGSRKNKKSSSTPSLPTSADHAENPTFRDRGQDLSLAFPSINPFAPLMPAPIVPEYLSSEYYGANTLRFPLDIDGVGGSGASGGYESGGGGGRLLFPFEETKMEVNDSNGSTDFKGLSGFWNGMMRGGGGSSSW